VKRRPRPDSAAWPTNELPATVPPDHATPPEHELDEWRDSVASNRDYDVLILTSLAAVVDYFDDL
jgi:hypothetical protein